MTIPTNPIEHFSPFLPATYNVPEEEDRLPSYLGEKLSQFAEVVNDKTIGIYRPTETRNGEAFFYRTTKITRFGYTSIVFIPSYPNSGVLIIDSNSNPIFPINSINNQFVISDLYGTASKPATSVGAGNGDYIKYNNRGDPRIFFDMSDLIITITTTVDLTAYQGFIICKYIRNGNP